MAAAENSMSVAPVTPRRCTRASEKLHGGSKSYRRSLLADGLLWYVLRSLRAVLLGSKMNILMPFSAFAMIASASGWSHGVVFAFALLAICPFAERLGYITEQLCLETRNPTLSGLINATFGNVTELIISIFALIKGKKNPLMLRIVQVSDADQRPTRNRPTPPPPVPPCRPRPAWINAARWSPCCVPLSPPYDQPLSSCPLALLPHRSFACLYR